MVRTLVNLPADSLDSFSYCHVLSRDAFSEPNPTRSRGSFHFEVHCTSPDKSDRSRTLQRKGPFRLTSAKGYLSEVQGFAQVLVHYCKSLPCLIQVGNALYPGYIACFLSSIKINWYLVDRSLVRGGSGLVFDGGDPHQGRSVGFYTAIKNGWIQW